MEQYEVMKEDAILGPFNIDEIAEFVHSGLILKRDYAYNIEYPDSFRTVDFFLKRHGKKVSIEHKGKWSPFQIIFCILCLFPVYGWMIGLLTFIVVKLSKGFWPIFGIRAIEDTKDPIKIYCDKKGLLGLYSKKRRITSARYVAIQQLPLHNYPAFICENDGRFCLYNFIQNKILFNDSERITYLGYNAVLIENENKKEKYSVIGMRLD